VGQSEDGVFIVAVRLIQALWFGVVVLTVLRWKRLGGATRLVSVLPAAFVLPQLFLGVQSYYPRHVVADYLVMSLAAVYVCSDYRAGPRGGRPGGANGIPSTATSQSLTI